MTLYLAIYIQFQCSVPVHKVLCPLCSDVESKDEEVIVVDDILGNTLVSFLAKRLQGGGNSWPGLCFHWTISG